MSEILGFQEIAWAIMIDPGTASVFEAAQGFTIDFFE